MEQENTSFVTVSWNRKHNQESVRGGYIRINSEANIGAAITQIQELSKQQDVVDFSIYHIIDGAAIPTLQLIAGMPENLETALSHAFLATKADYVGVGAKNQSALQEAAV